MTENTFLEHLEELRKRLIVIVIFFAVFSIIGFYLSDILISRINADLFPDSVGVELIVTQPLDFLYTKMNIGLFFGLFLSVPIILYQLFVFARPAMHERERRLLVSSVLGGFVLFIIGAAFSYFIILKFIVWFLAGLGTSAGIANLWNVNYFISFIFMFCIMLGLVFQLPIITTALLKLDIVKLEDLKKKRGYVAILAFLAAAIITPTVDPLTQLIVAVPILVLYELSILSARIFG